MAKAKTHAQAHCGYTENERVRSGFKGQIDEKSNEKALRGVVRVRKASIIAAMRTTARLMRAGTAGIPDCTAQAAHSGRDKRTM
jgi:hypothetical protein